MSTALASFGEVYADRLAPARAWKAAGGRSVGYFCDHVPVELIAAAGFLPVRVHGDPDYDRDIEHKYVQPYIPKLFASVRQAGLEFVNSICARIIAGDFKDLDFLIISVSRKPIINILPQLWAAKEHFPQIQLPEIHVLDHAHTPFDSAHAFNRRSLLTLKTKLEEWSGQPIADPELAGAVKAGNEGRSLMRKVNALRTASPPKLSGTEFLEVAGSGMVMDRSRHNAMIEALLNDPPTAARQGLRVFVGGSPTDNLQLYQAIEARGATVVGEDHCWGERCSDLPIATENGLTEGVIGHWVSAPRCGLRFPIEASPNNTVARAKASRADCAILSVYDADEMQVWDTPQEVTALRAAGLPTLHMRSQPYRIDPAKVGAEVGKFLADVAKLKETV